MSKRLTDEQVCPGCQRWVDEGRPPNGGCPDHGRRAVPWTYPAENEAPKRLTDERLKARQADNEATVFPNEELRAILAEALERGREVRDRDRRIDNLRREFNDVEAAAQQQEQAYNVVLRERDRLRAQVEALFPADPNDGDDWCMCCGVNLDLIANHDPDCLWVRGRAALDAAQNAPLAEGEG